MTNDKDGSVFVQVSGDEMTAEAFIMPPEGNGKPADVADVKKAAKEAGVVHGIVGDDRLQYVVDEGKSNPTSILVAKSISPGHGMDAEVQLMWKTETDHGKNTGEGNVNLRELDLVKSVEKDQVIAKKTLPTRGEEGVTVTGKKTPGEWGMDRTLTAGANVVVSEDGTEFRAAISGCPKITGNVVSVDPMYLVPGDVDYSIGNIHFAGALHILGSITDGFIVRADGDIIIDKNVQACQVISGGDITVRGGIITQKDGLVSAGGSVTALFIENSNVEAKVDVIAGRAIINSTVRSNGKVVCTSKEGKIMGGDTMAYNEIRARHLGTITEAPTILRAGFKYDNFLNTVELEKKIEKVNKEIAELRKNLSSAKSAKTDTIAGWKQSAEELEAAKTSMTHQLSVLKSQAIMNPFAMVKGEEFIHPGALIYIGDYCEKVKKPMKFTSLSSDRDGGLVLSSYDEYSREVKTMTIRAKEKKKSILIVDDAKFMRAKLRLILEEGNFNVVGEAEDGRQAIQLFERLKPDIVTMDITMPVLDGIASLKEIKKLKPEARIIMISALGQKEKVRDSLVAGAMDFILKPFVAEKVVEVVSRASRMTKSMETH